MKPLKPQNPDRSELFHDRLDNQVNMSHEVVRLSALIDWTMFDDRFGELYHTEVGWLGRNHLKGTEGDNTYVLLNCAGHNLRLILKCLRESSTGIICRSVFRWIFRQNLVSLRANNSSGALSVA